MYFFVQPTNLGTRGRDTFAVVPEVQVKAGWQVRPGVRTFASYNFLYWSSVARPGDQIDPVVNTNLVPTSTTFGNPGGPARPAFNFRETDFWAQGVNVGLQLRW